MFVGAADDCRLSCYKSPAAESALCQPAFHRDNKHLASLSYKDRKVYFGSQFKVPICAPLALLLRKGAHHCARQPNLTVRSRTGSHNPLRAHAPHDQSTDHQALVS